MATSFLEVRFPVDISHNASGGARFRTLIHRADSGSEQRIQTWSEPLCEYTFDYFALTHEQREKIIALHRIARGKLSGFRFKDWSDYRITESDLGDSTGGNVLQASKSYHFEGLSVQRIIRKLVAGTVVVKVNGIVDGSAAVNLNTGAVASAQSGMVTLTAEFDVPVRFDLDYLPATMVTDQIAQWEQIPLVGVRV